MARLLRMRGQFMPTMAGDETRSVDELRKVAATAPAGSPARHSAYHAIGTTLWQTYLRDEDPDTLEEAIRALQAAVAERPEGGGEQPAYLNDLGIALSERTFVTGSAQGMADAVAAWVRALRVLEATFAAVPVAYKVGQQGFSASLGIAERAVAGYLYLADVMATEEGRARMLRNAMWTAESSKSRPSTELDRAQRDYRGRTACGDDGVPRARPARAATAIDVRGPRRPGHRDAADVDRGGAGARRPGGAMKPMRAGAEMAATGTEAEEYAAVRRGVSGDLGHVHRARGQARAGWRAGVDVHDEPVDAAVRAPCRRGGPGRLRAGDRPRGLARRAAPFRAGGATGHGAARPDLGRAAAAALRRGEAAPRRREPGRARTTGMGAAAALVRCRRPGGLATCGWWADAARHRRRARTPAAPAGSPPTGPPRSVFFRRWHGGRW